MKTKEDYKEYRRAYLKRTNNASCKKYEKTKHGFLMRCYRNMQSRVTGVQKKKFHLYAGKPLLDRESFYEWAHADETFHKLFDAWEEEGYERRMSPSINRINADGGYTLDNIEWLTHSENSRRTRRWGYQSRHIAV
jgi:hypothetical protein